MENKEIQITKKPTSEAMKRAKKKYYEKKKQDEEFLQNLREKTKVWTKEHKNDDKYIQTMRANSKQYYEKNREKVLERMRNYNAKKKEQLSINILLPNIL